MRNGKRDGSNPVLDATVHVGDGCTGVLISPTLVLTAGHCVPDRSRPKLPRRTLWNNLSSAVRVDFGNDKQNFRLVRWAREYNPAGLIDVSLLRLDQPVGPDVAEPVRPMTIAPNGTSPIQFLRGKTLVAAGWGTPGGRRYRQTGETRFDVMPYDQFGTREPARFKTRGNNELQLGDSGSPVYWISPRTAVRHVVGIAQGIERNGGRYYCLASDGGVEPKKKFRQPSLAAWLDRELANEALPAQPILPLYSWWNRDTSDNYATTAPGWGYTPTEYAPSGIVYREALEHILNGRERDGYRLYRHEGYLFDPHQSQPPDTVPVFSWHHRGRGDHFLSSDPRWTIPLRDVRWRRDHTALTNRVTKDGYALRRLEGYAFDPRRPQPPGTIPLYSWWHPGRQDNYASTDPRWAGDASDLRWEDHHLRDQITVDGYSRYRLEGFALPAVRT